MRLRSWLILALAGKNMSVAINIDVNRDGNAVSVPERCTSMLFESVSVLSAGKAAFYFPRCIRATRIAEGGVWGFYLLRIVAVTLLAVLITHALTGCAPWNDTRTPREKDEQRRAAQGRMVEWCDVRGGHKSCRWVPESEVRRAIETMQRGW